jgi:hypothetical protein
MGGSFGVAVLGAVMNARLASELPDRIPGEALAEMGVEVSDLLNSPAAIRALPAPVANGVISSLEVAVQTVFWWSVPMMLVGFILALFLKEIPLRDTVGPERATAEPSVEPTLV